MACYIIGCALNARRINSSYRTYVLLGDGEAAEGSGWEAADAGAVEPIEDAAAATGRQAKLRGE